MISDDGRRLGFQRAVEFSIVKQDQLLIWCANISPNCHYQLPRLMRKERPFSQRIGKTITYCHMLIHPIKAGEIFIFFSISALIDKILSYLCNLIRRQQNSWIFRYGGTFQSTNIWHCKQNYIYPNMDLPDRLSLDIDDFFHEEMASLRLPTPSCEQEEGAFAEEAFCFNMEESLDLFQNHPKLPLPLGPHSEECWLLREKQDIDDTNPLEGDSSESEPNLQDSSHISDLINDGHLCSDFEVLAYGGCQQPEEGELEEMINYLVEFSNLPTVELRLRFMKRFPRLSQWSMAETLIQKFSKIKKTKEELIKYCMRKAFKFILELPKNRHMLNGDKSEKFSFSKCKNRYLKKVSDQKSMNNKFLQQLFSDQEFSSDYKVFLDNFEEIMMEDNEKKVKYLAWLLTHQKDGKKKSVEVVKRLPWTHFILQKVRKISQELLKFTSG